MLVYAVLDKEKMDKMFQAFDKDSHRVRPMMAGPRSYPWNGSKGPYPGGLVHLWGDAERMVLEQTDRKLMIYVVRTEWDRCLPSPEIEPARYLWDDAHLYRLEEPIPEGS